MLTFLGTTTASTSGTPSLCAKHITEVWCCFASRIHLRLHLCYTCSFNYEEAISYLRDVQQLSFKELYAFLHNIQCDLHT
ncbi:hypothetical protein E2C01_014944 [Portunus trituberculatus]|uniref:Uncharacterized protein n=1 Tax=Portunus trituberculatus TaxID=210409 RepID=A0A5B7DK05_PORTR|nr:hypothetical protein [Portunus trituberculatus]